MNVRWIHVSRQLHRIKYDLTGNHIYEIKKLWRNEEEMRRNHIVLETGLGDIEIHPICYEGRGCQGYIVVKKKGETVLRAELKGGTIIWFLGDKVRENDVPTFIEWANYTIWITSIVKPVVDLLPPEYYMKREWDVEVTLFDSHYGLPEYARNQPHDRVALKLTR